MDSSLVYYAFYTDCLLSHSLFHRFNLFILVVRRKGLFSVSPFYICHIPPTFFSWLTAMIMNPAEAANTMESGEYLGRQDVLCSCITLPDH